MPSCALHQRVVPGIGRVAALGAQLVEQAHRPLAAREDGQQLALARQVEADDDTLVAMFDEEAVRAVGKRAHQLELVGGEPEPLDIVGGARSEEHTSELQSLMRISYAVFCLKKKQQCHKRTYQPKKHST